MNNKENQRPVRSSYRTNTDLQANQRSNAQRPVRTHGKKKKSWTKILLIAVLLVAGLFAAKSFIKGKDWTIAVFGVDSRDGNLEKNTRSDVIMLVNINQRSGDVKLVSVYRDSYLSTGDGHYNKINSAYDKGGHKQAVKALEENLDIHIDDYVTFGWSAVAKGINALGGIDLELSDAEFSMINAFITETVESTGIGSVHLEHAGMNHLDGVQAVAYGRLRLIDTDFNRTARQRKVISLALEKAKQADTKMLIQAATSLISEVSTSIGIDDVIPIIRTLDKYQLNEDSQAGFPFSRKSMKIGKLDCVVPTTLYSNVIMLHEFLYGTEDYKPSETVKKISNKIAEDSGLTEEGEVAPEAKTGGGKVYKPKAKTPQAPETEVPAESVTESESMDEILEESLDESLDEESSESDNNISDIPEELPTDLEETEESTPAKPSSKPDKKPNVKPGENSEQEGPGVEGPGSNESGTKHPLDKEPENEGPGAGSGDGSQIQGPGTSKPIESSPASVETPELKETDDEQYDKGDYITIG
ncbi:MAG: LCP family protein [Eubacteriales bacterium]|nr:LCP family protein [Eubacteriales bacterium]